MVENVAMDELDALIDDFVSINYNTEVARKNVKYYLVWLKRFLQATGKDFRYLTQQDIIRFRRWIGQQKGRNNKPLSAKTIRQLLSFIKSFYDFLESLGYNNPFKELPTVMRKKLVPRVKSDKVPREFNDDELKAIFEYLKKANQDVLLACLISYATGARLNEVLNLKAEDVIVRGDKVLIIIRAGKGLRERISIVGVPVRNGNGEVLSDTLAMLNKLAKGMLLERVKKVKKGYLFGDEVKRNRVRKNIQQTLYRLSRRLGIEVHFHNFRSNWGAKALAAGVPLEYVSHQLGHKYTSTTEKYYAQVKDEYVIEFIHSLI